MILLDAIDSPSREKRFRGRSAVGSAEPCQGSGRGFEPRRPLHLFPIQTIRIGEEENKVKASFGGMAERRGRGLQIPVHGFKSRFHLQN